MKLKREEWLNPKYTSKDIFKNLDYDSSTINKWIKKKFIYPIVPARGSGTKNFYNKLNIFQMFLFFNLKDVISGIIAGDISQYLEDKIQTLIENNGEIPEKDISPIGRNVTLKIMVRREIERFLGQFRD